MNDPKSTKPEKPKENKNNDYVMCSECFNRVYVNKLEKFYYKGRGIYVKCPSCRTKLYNIKHKGIYYKKENGQIIRRLKKVRMSKKERLKLRKLQKSLQ